MTHAMACLNRDLSSAQVLVERKAGIRLRGLHDELHEVDIDEQRSLRDSALPTRKQILRARTEASSSSQGPAVQHRLALLREVTFPLASFIKN